MPRQRRNPLNTMNNQRSKAAQKENNLQKASQNTKISDINDRKFKTAAIKILKEM